MHPAQTLLHTCQAAIHTLREAATDGARHPHLAEEDEAPLAVPHDDAHALARGGELQCVQDLRARTLAE